MSLKSFCKLIVGSIILSMAVPGLAVLPPKLHFLTEAGLVGHALLLRYVEISFSITQMYTTMVWMMM